MLAENFIIYVEKKHATKSAELREVELETYLGFARTCKTFGFLKIIGCIENAQWTELIVGGRLP